jgi:hypothetical protein
LSSSSSSSGVGPPQNDGTVINSTFRTTASIQTSTTREVVRDFTSTYSFVDDGEEVIFGPTLKWTTTKTGDVVEFTEVETVGTIYSPTFGDPAVYPEQLVPRTYTEDATTNLTDTQTLGLAATIVQANTRNSEAEILWSISSAAATWDGFADATAVAQSGTRITVAPSFVTAAIPVKNATVTTSSTIANPEVTWSTAWFPSRTTQQDVTTTTSIFRVPAVTGTRTTRNTTTTASQTTLTIFPAATLSYGRTGGATTSSATTSIVTSHGTVSRIVERYAGTLLFESTTTNTYSATRYITTSAAATLTSTSQAANTLRTQEGGTTVDFAGDQIVYPEPQVSARGLLNVDVGINLAGPFRTRIITAGAIAEESTGHYFTADFTTTVQMVTLPRSGLVLYPATYPYLTVEGNSVTYTTSTNKSVGTGTESTTSSGEVSVSGTSFTRTEALTLARPAHQGAHSVGAGCSLVDVMPAGAFRDRIGGTTSSFYGEATLYTEAESAPIRYWSPIAQITPLELRGNKNAVTFSVPRNVDDIPPVSSRNAW